MPPSGSFGGPKGQKWPKVFPLAKIEISFFRAENFFVVTRTKSGCVFFLFLKNTKYIRQEKQNTEKTVKNPFFSDGTNFLKAAKFYRNDISKKKKTTPRFDWSTCKKNFSPIGPAVSKKKGENFFFLLKNWFWEKPKIKKKISFSGIECT